MFKILTISTSLLLLNSLTFAQNTALAPTEKTEVQVAICEEASSVTEKLQIGSWKLKRELQTRLVDTSKLDLYRAGLVFRIRINQQKDKVEVALKKKVADFYQSESYSRYLDCEYDQHQEQRKRTCKMSYEMPLEQWRQTLDENNPAQLLSTEQTGWLRELGQTLPQDLRMTDIIEGPSYTKKMTNYEKMIDITRDRRGQEYLEISAKVATGLIPAVEAELIAELAEKNIQICNSEMSRLTYRKLTSFFGF